MSEGIKPALTAEEWAKDLGEWAKPEVAYKIHQAPGQTVLDGAFNDHALAARLLHGQPFGFTREDVEDEREELVWFEYRYDVANNGVNDVAALRKLVGRKKDRIARIEALLPPEEDTDGR